MAMKISCPCGEEVQVPEMLLDHGVRCPHCGQPVELPVALDAREGSDAPMAEALPAAAAAEETDELAIAIDSPVVLPGARAKQPETKSNGDGDEPAAPGKRRDRWPIIITAAAFGMLIIVLLAVIAASGDPPTEADESAENESHQPARPLVTAPGPTGTRGSYGGNADLFPNVPGNRTRKDYEEEQRRKRESGQ